MEFKIKLQEYQTEAVEAVTEVFRGQPRQGDRRYRTFIQAHTAGKSQASLFGELEGFGNAEVELSDEALIENVRRVQSEWRLPLSKSLSKGPGRIQLDIEMETGTGKTYVYIKTIYELYRRYGWSKYIIVVPSIAIREGVLKSFSTYERHFQDYYTEVLSKEGREFQPLQAFVYDSDRLEELRTFGDAGLRVMIINSQAFNSSFTEGKNNNAARIIYSTRDSFGSRRPIEAVADTRPIIIQDEPQRLEGDKTQKSLLNFRPLFTLYYSATHRTKHDTIYALDALDAYRKKLVKRIEVKGIEEVNNPGTSAYLYLQEIILSKKEQPKARVELFVKGAGGTVRRKSVTLLPEDDLYIASGELEAYRGLVVEGIEPLRGLIRISGGLVLRRGEPVGNERDEENIRKIQIRETVKSHLEKEAELYDAGIKVLSLFFIDHVSDYRIYEEDEAGNAVTPGKLQTWFEEIYEEEKRRLLSRLSLSEKYRKYLEGVPTAETHRGYFSQDKKGKSIDTVLKRGSDESDTPSDYELILKDKERLLSFEEPARFIFSHSALREGWDNPNIFQICTLRPTKGEIQKRQSVGRGLRICVNQRGERQDLETLGADRVHEVNLLTVIANESYADFTEKLQEDIRQNLRLRPHAADREYLSTPLRIDGTDYRLTEAQTTRLQSYLLDNGYVDEKDFAPTPKLAEDFAKDQMEAFPEKLSEVLPAVKSLIAGLTDSTSLEDIVAKAEDKSLDNDLNENFDKEEFRALWKRLNHKYYYTVHYNSRNLVTKAIAALGDRLSVRTLRYEVERGLQNAETADDFGKSQRAREVSLLSSYGKSSAVQYDVVGSIASRTKLLRTTIAEILRGLTPEKFDLLRLNPEDFIANASKIILGEKATTFVKGLSYRASDQTFDNTIFTSTIKGMPGNYKPHGEKHITPYAEVDSEIEEQFALDLDKAKEVTVYAKLPRAYKIPTPVGDYSPDWAIAFDDGNTHHVYFVAETKGTLDDMDLRPIEKGKIDSARVLFESVVSSDGIPVMYKQVRTYGDLLNALGVK